MLKKFLKSWHDKDNQSSRIFFRIVGIIFAAELETLVSLTESDLSRPIELQHLLWGAVSPYQKEIKQK